MLHLAWKIICRIIAHGLVDLVQKIVSWLGRRYASWLALILILFIGLSIANDHLSQWVRSLGVFASLFLPSVLAVITVAVFVMLADLRAIEPIKPSEVLHWNLDDVMPYPTDDLVAVENEQKENDQSIASEA